MRFLHVLSRSHCVRHTSTSCVAMTSAERIETVSSVSCRMSFIRLAGPIALILWKLEQNVESRYLHRSVVARSRRIEVRAGM